MQAPDLEGLPPPPGVIGSLKAGFDTISVHLTAILLPLALDLLLWFGPHLSVRELYEKQLPGLLAYLQKYGSVATQTAVDSAQAQTGNIDAFNLLIFLRTFPIGVTSLFVNPFQPFVQPLTPMGKPTIVQLGAFGDIFWVYLIVTLLGWLAGAVYFRSVASLVVPAGTSVQIGAIVQSLVLSLMAAGVLVFAGVPILLIIGGLMTLSPAIAQMALLMLGIMSMWVVVPLFFAGHGIFIRSQTALDSILSGVRMARFSLPNSSLFVLSVLFISIGLNYVWIIPKPDSWMLLVGIIGHAFITTGLLAASFIYYRDMTTWLQTVFEHLQSKATSTKA